MRRAWSHRACAAVCCCALAGCRFALLADRDWTAREAPPAGPGATAAPERRAPKTVPMEIVFARADEHDATWQDDLWRLADEQAFDGDLRRRLAANGLRAGLLTGSLPPELAARLEPSQPPVTDEPPGAPEERPAVTRRHLKLLPGRDSEVVAGSAIAELVILEHDGTEVHGGTYRDATTYFSLRAWPAADGRVRVELVPTLKHGPIERSWVGTEGIFRLETGQRRRPLGRLALTATIPQGTTLLVGPSGDTTATVGGAFFLERSAAGKTRRLLALRPQGRPVDPVFETPVFETPAFETPALEASESADVQAPPSPAN